MSSNEIIGAPQYQRALTTRLTEYSNRFANKFEKKQVIEPILRILNNVQTVEHLKACKQALETHLKPGFFLNFRKNNARKGILKHLDMAIQEAMKAEQKEMKVEQKEIHRLNESLGDTAVLLDKISRMTDIVDERLFQLSGIRDSQNTPDYKALEAVHAKLYVESNKASHSVDSRFDTHKLKTTFKGSDEEVLNRMLKNEKAKIQHSGRAEQTWKDTKSNPSKPQEKSIHDSSKQNPRTEKTNQLKQSIKPSEPVLKTKPDNAQPVENENSRFSRSK